MDIENFDEAVARRSRALRTHCIAFAGVSLVLCAIDLAFSDERWFHWPVMVWGALLLVHTLYCKTLAVDEEWAESRTNELRLKSYDLGHIQDIEGSFIKSQQAEDTPKEQKN